MSYFLLGTIYWWEKEVISCVMKNLIRLENIKCKLTFLICDKKIWNNIYKSALPGLWLHYFYMWYLACLGDNITKQYSRLFYHQAIKTLISHPSVSVLPQCHSLTRPPATLTNKIRPALTHYPPSRNQCSQDVHHS